MSSIEQRGATRYRFLGFATIPCEITSGTKTWQGMVTNASETGLGIEVSGLSDEFNRNASININLDLHGESWQLGGRLTHIDAQQKHRRLRLGVKLSSDQAASALQRLCQGLAHSGRASGLDLRRTADEGSVMTIHGVLSLKTISDAVNIIATNHIARVDFSHCKSDGRLGAHLGLVAIEHKVKMSGCCSGLKRIMNNAKVCEACLGC